MCYHGEVVMTSVRQAGVVTEVRILDLPSNSSPSSLASHLLNWWRVESIVRCVHILSEIFPFTAAAVVYQTSVVIGVISEKTFYVNFWGFKLPCVIMVKW